MSYPTYTARLVGTDVDGYEYREAGRPAADY